MQDLFEEYLKDRPQRLCKKCGECCKKINCQHLTQDNLCFIYKSRPKSCRDFPSSPFEPLPEGCGFEGWLFQKREEIKQQVRKKKEDLLSLEILLKTANEESIEKITAEIEQIKQIIKVFEKYGSTDW